ncbi:hypothetical protein PYH58_11675 [Mammaliicoccus sciuri]|uniref:hypothetical protein n=1 Tax=Mammaliicoccus sciuri TaxID=1296 RepID=UPI003364F0FE
MSKENLRTIIVIIVVSMIAILSFGLVIGQMVEKEYIYETLMIIISFVGVFATFCGAYLGALIAGKYTLKTVHMNEDIKRVINEKKALQLMENLINITKEMLDRARPQDASGLIQFQELEYKPLNEFYIKEIEKNLKNINDFRLSDNYFYLSNESMDSLEELYSTVYKLTLNINDLNERNFRNEDEENPVFEIVKREFFRNLHTFYKQYKDFYKVEF